MVAAILHLNEGAHATFELVDEILGGNGERGVRRGRAVLAPGLVAPGLVAPSPGTELFFVAQHQGDLGHGCEGPGLDLRGAAGDHDAHIRALALDPTDGLTRLSYRFSRHCTGIDDDG